MSRVAHSTSITTPVPHLTAPICDDFAERIPRGATTNSAHEQALDTQCVGRLRRIGAARLRPWGLAALVDKAQLLISELVTNALRYGEGDAIEFRLVVTRRGMLITVNDGSARRPHLRMVGASSETGRGLVLVAAIADAWGVSPDGTTTWCTLSVAGTGR
jgi:anti-sigma regulatory factor (Ser/Thr protein kinase)